MYTFTAVHIVVQSRARKQNLLTIQWFNIENT